MNTKTAAPAALLLATALAGCAAQMYTAEEQAVVGDALRADVALQTIDPAAGLKPLPPTPTDAQKMQAGVERYRKDDGKVEDESLIKDVAGSEE